MPDSVIVQQPAPRRAGVRCSDVDRERTSARLREAVSDGRLTMDELEERLSATYAARYTDELEVITDDLPTSERVRTGWRAIFIMIWVQICAELAILRGRAPSGSKYRRWVLGGVVGLLLLFILGGIAGAVFGFGGGGEHHGFGPGRFRPESR